MNTLWTIESINATTINFNLINGPTIVFHVDLNTGDMYCDGTKSGNYQRISQAILHNKFTMYDIAMECAKKGIGFESW